MSTGELSVDRFIQLEKDIKEIKEALLGTMVKPGGLLHEHSKLQETWMDHENRLTDLEDAKEERGKRLEEVERQLAAIQNAKASLSAKLWDILKGPIGHGVTLLLGILAARLIH